MFGNNEQHMENVHRTSVRLRTEWPKIVQQIRAHQWTVTSQTGRVPDRKHCEKVRSSYCKAMNTFKCEQNIGNRSWWSNLWGIFTTWLQRRASCVWLEFSNETQYSWAMAWAYGWLLDIKQEARLWLGCDHECKFLECIFLHMQNGTKFSKQTEEIEPFNRFFVTLKTATVTNICFFAWNILSHRRQSVQTLSTDKW